MIKKTILNKNIFVTNYYNILMHPLFIYETAENLIWLHIATYYK